MTSLKYRSLFINRFEPGKGVDLYDRYILKSAFLGQTYKSRLIRQIDLYAEIYSIIILLIGQKADPKTSGPQLRSRNLAYLAENTVVMILIVIRADRF